MTHMLTHFKNIINIRTASHLSWDKTPALAIESIIRLQLKIISQLVHTQSPLSLYNIPQIAQTLSVHSNTIQNYHHLHHINQSPTLSDHLSNPSKTTTTTNYPPKPNRRISITLTNKAIHPSNNITHHNWSNAEHVAVNLTHKVSESMKRTVIKCFRKKGKYSTPDSRELWTKCRIPMQTTTKPMPNPPQQAPNSPNGRPNHWPSVPF
jgi:hypothetical protein